MLATDAQASARSSGFCCFGCEEIEYARQCAVQNLEIVTQARDTLEVGRVAVSGELAGQALRFRRRSDAILASVGKEYGHVAIRRSRGSEGGF